MTAIDRAARVIAEQMAEPYDWVLLTTVPQALADAGLLVTNATPPGREQSLALTHLEEVSMWSNAVIMRREG